MYRLSFLPSGLFFNETMQNSYFPLKIKEKGYFHVWSNPNNNHIFKKQPGKDGQRNTSCLAAAACLETLVANLIWGIRSLELASL